MTADEIRKQARKTLTTIYDISGRKDADPIQINLGASIHLVAATYEIAAQLADLNDTLARLVDIIHDKS